MRMLQEGWRRPGIYPRSDRTVRRGTLNIVSMSIKLTKILKKLAHCDRVYDI